MYYENLLNKMIYNPSHTQQCEKHLKINNRIISLDFYLFHKVDYIVIDYISIQIIQK